MPNSNCLRILVLGYMVRGPLGGLAWHHLQYVLGLHKLGHDVYFLEDSDDFPGCYDPSKHVTSYDPTYGLRFVLNTFEKVGLRDRWAYYDAHTLRWFGPCAGRIFELCDTADVLLNVSGVNPIRPWLAQIPLRVFIDTDPVFTQCKHLSDDRTRKMAEQHTHYFTFGENFARHGCMIPDDGFAWSHTRQPVVLDAWKVTPTENVDRFTTVMQWDSYKQRKYDGVRYGMKVESFDSYMTLPKHTSAKLELAIGSTNAPRIALREHGWLLQNPLEAAKDPWAYQHYIRNSMAEFSVAKHGYVVSNSGWFSERSACYLASGRPVVTENTGFTQWLDPEIGGVLAFRCFEEAITCIESVISNYNYHSRVAREIAEEYFGSKQVLTTLIDRILSN